MQESQVIIERVRRVGGAIQQLDIAVDVPQRTVQAGQVFLARATDSYDPYLREPWVPIRKRGGTVTVERSVTVTYQPGQVVGFLGPVGKPLLLRETARTLLLIAFDSTPAALLMLAEQALNVRVAVALALIGEAQYYPLEALPPEIEILRGEDATWQGQRDSIRWADQIVAVAPPPQDRAYYLKLRAAAKDARGEIAPGYVLGLFQPPMPCGVGACLACLVRVRGEDVAACVEGPTFDLALVSLE